ncbi:hypothetical protein TSUD_197920 [Trifolium subterraneum]|uniref:TF-B3 domain-containing protein n=1 Tax=Trifolium subterraneum TaxID=3900 RepID=A0A2Z6MCW9_TRISU|nr:hypothetical protein TSUD_197920 [Trifolium subterraneum]
MVKHLYPSLRFTLSRSLFGTDKNPNWAMSIPLPYIHNADRFTYNFMIILTNSDVTSGYLTMSYGKFASQLFSNHVRCMKFVDEKGLEWICGVQSDKRPYNHVKFGGKWGSMVRARNYTQGDHIMFGSPFLGNATELFVKKIC